MPMGEGQPPMTAAKSEFSHVVALEELRGGTVRRSIEAGEPERRGLATRFGLSAIDSLTAKVSLESLAKGRLVLAKGEFTADVTQTCVVTLQPLPRKVTESFVLRFAVEPETGESPVIDVDPTAEDEPEPIEGGSVDIGELVAQHLSLALDPYPRVVDAELEAEAQPAGKTAADGPFAKLAQLKPKG